MEEEDDGARRDAEVEAIVAIYGGEDGAWVNVHPFPQREELRAKEVQCTVRVVLPELASDAGGRAVFVEFQVGKRYPSEERLVASVNGGGLSAQAQREMNAKLAQLAQDNVGNESMMAAIQFVEEEWPLVAKKSEKDAQQQQHSLKSSPPRSSRVLSRQCMYSHHIISGKKREFMRECTQELSLAAYVKIGWPGVIVIEGEQVDCDDFVSRLSRLRWKHFVLRGVEQVQVGQDDDLEEHRALIPGYREYGDKDMSVFAQDLKTVGLEELFLTCMKIYR